MHHQRHAIGSDDPGRLSRLGDVVGLHLAQKLAKRACTVAASAPCNSPASSAKRCCTWSAFNTEGRSVLAPVGNAWLPFLHITANAPRC